MKDDILWRIYFRTVNKIDQWTQQVFYQNSSLNQIQVNVFLIRLKIFFYILNIYYIIHFYEFYVIYLTRFYFKMKIY